MTTYEKLCAALRGMDTATMELPEIVAACEAVEPTVTPPEILAAMRQVAGEQLAEAEQLEKYGRCRMAGIKGVIHGGKPC